MTELMHNDKDTPLPTEGGSGSTATAAGTRQAVSGPSIPSPPPEDGSAKYDVASHLRLWPVAAAGLVLDLWSKHWAFSALNLGPGENMNVIPFLLDFQKMLNRGALFGLGKGWTFLFIAASFLALAFVFFLFCQSSKKRWTLHIALAFVLAGALGNLYDRAFAIADVIVYQINSQKDTIVGTIRTENDQFIVLDHFPGGQTYKTVAQGTVLEQFQQGVVRDFLRLRLGPLEIWPWIFNVADVLLVAGVTILLLNFWSDRKAEKAAQERSAAEHDDTPVPDRAVADKT